MATSAGAGAEGEKGESESLFRDHVQFNSMRNVGIFTTNPLRQ